MQQPLAALSETLADIERDYGPTVCDLMVGPFFKPTYPHQREAVGTFYREAKARGLEPDLVDNSYVLSVTVRLRAGRDHDRPLGVPRG